MKEFHKSIFLAGIVLVISLGVAIHLSNSNQTYTDEKFDKIEKNNIERFEQERIMDLSDQKAQKRLAESGADERDNLEAELGLNASSFQIVKYKITAGDNFTFPESTTPPTNDTINSTISITDSATVKVYDKNGTLIYPQDDD